ncbi:unnamed protein product [Protopolystoma xenopodis]|uniref:Uncharacterized protein n=1 Tax=Protopolystoma xenopodis TaxID=117903 RepID=A0A448WUV0_9PLAT|nr:unnamed protein product [Protopolystoma xenopodis]
MVIVPTTSGIRTDLFGWTEAISPPVDISWSVGQTPLLCFPCLIFLLLGTEPPELGRLVENPYRPLLKPKMPRSLLAQPLRRAEQFKARQKGRVLSSANLGLSHPPMKEDLHTPFASFYTFFHLLFLHTSP